MIELDNITLSQRLHHIHCRIPEQQLTGIIGANGAGKSSLLKVIAGLLSPDGGEVRINQQRLLDLSYPQRSRLIAYLGQDTPIHWRLNVYEVIALGAINPLPKAKERQRVHTLAEQFQVSHLLEQSVQTLSGGERARVQLARCLMKSAPILLVDEPIAALDPYYQIEIMAHLQRLSKNMTCLVILHQLSLAYQYCDTLLLMKNGTLLASGLADEVIMTENLATAFSISATINRQTKTIHSIKQLSL